MILGINLCSKNILYIVLTIGSLVLFLFFISQIKEALVITNISEDLEDSVTQNQVITSLPCDTSLLFLLSFVEFYPNKEWVLVDTLKEILCYILTYNPDLQNVLYTTRCDIPPPFLNSSITSNISICFVKNSEHTLQVGKGIPGVIPYIYNNYSAGINKTYSVYLNYYYQVPVDKISIIIDYSVPNIENMIRSKQYLNFVNNTVYVPPYFYEPLKEHRNRTTDILSTVGNPNAANARRQKFFNRLTSLGIKWTLKNSRSYDELIPIMDDAKILFNIHQSDEAHTFEELRCLPALMRKVVVVSEISALQETIPYHEYVIWASINDLPRVINDTLTNYDQIYERIHGNSSRFREICANMTNKAAQELTKIIRQVTGIAKSDHL